MKRKTLSKQTSQKVFGKTADLTHKFNLSTRSMRGGYRM